MKVVLIAASLTIAFGGCASSGDETEDEVRSWARQIRFLEPHQIGDREFEEIAALEEEAIISNGGEGEAIDRAKEQMRDRAARVDADAVVITFCGRSSDPMEASMQLAHTVRCQGVAIRWRLP